MASEKRIQITEGEKLKGVHFLTLESQGTTAPTSTKHNYLCMVLWELKLHACRGFTVTAATGPTMSMWGASDSVQTGCELEGAAPTGRGWQRRESNIHWVAPSSATPISRKNLSCPLGAAQSSSGKFLRSIWLVKRDSTT